MDDDHDNLHQQGEATDHKDITAFDLGMNMTKATHICSDTVVVDVSGEPRNDLRTSVPCIHTYDRNIHTHIIAAAVYVTFERAWSEASEMRL